MKFTKISYEQWFKDTEGVLSPEVAKAAYNDIKLPQRATENSAGYDFYIPYAIPISAGQTTKILTGIRWENYDNPNVFLMLCPRSGLGSKFGFRLVNTVGIVDADYCNALNEGHIMANVKADKDLFLANDDRFMQGIIIPFNIVENDAATGQRIGGFGSTNDNKR